MSHTITYNNHKYKCSRWLKDKISALKKIDSRTLEEEFELYLSYGTAMHIPFYYGPKSSNEIEVNKIFTELGIRLHSRHNYI